MIWTTGALTPFSRPDGWKTLIVPDAEARAYEAERRGTPPPGLEDEVGGAPRRRCSMTRSRGPSANGVSATPVRH